MQPTTAPRHQHQPLKKSLERTEFGNLTYLAGKIKITKFVEKFFQTWYSPFEDLRGNILTARAAGEDNGPTNLEHDLAVRGNSTP